MEIPENLKTLYHHWSFYTKKPSSNFAKSPHTSDIKEIEKFIKERMIIWEKKINGSQPPYTNDPILANYRFCNIYRELDKQTIALHTKLVDLQSDFPLWLLNTAFIRFICNPDTVERIGLLSFDAKENQKVRRRLKELPRPKYGTAYIFPISVISKTDYPTREDFFCTYLPETIPRVAKLLLQLKSSSVVDALKIILPEFGFNMKFHWTEILIDTAYQFPELINLNKRFPIGPGALPTIKDLFPSIHPEEANLILSQMQPDDFPYLQLNGKSIYLTCENWEGICCEFRKYSNLKNGYGRKRLYKPTYSSV